MINPGSATENGVLMAARGDALSIKFWGLSLFSQAFVLVPQLTTKHGFKGAIQISKLANPRSDTENGVLLAARTDALLIKFWGLSLFSQAFVLVPQLTTKHGSKGAIQISKLARAQLGSNRISRAFLEALSTIDL